MPFKDDRNGQARCEQDITGYTTPGISSGLWHKRCHTPAGPWGRQAQVWSRTNLYLKGV